MTETQRDDCLIQLVKSVNNLENKMNSFENKLNKNIEFTKSIDAKLNENIEFTRRINGSVAVIEHTHGDKLNALFDGYKANSEKLDKIETDIQDIYSILQKHEDKFFVIESK